MPPAWNAAPARGAPASAAPAGPARCRRRSRRRANPQLVHRHRPRAASTGSGSVRGTASSIRPAATGSVASCRRPAKPSIWLASSASTISLVWCVSTWTYVPDAARRSAARPAPAAGWPGSAAATRSRPAPLWRGLSDTRRTRSISPYSLSTSTARCSRGAVAGRARARTNESPARPRRAAIPASPRLGDVEQARGLADGAGQHDGAEDFDLAQAHRCGAGYCPERCGGNWPGRPCTTGSPGGRHP